MSRNNLREHSSELDRQLALSDSEQSVQSESSDFVDDTDEDPDFDPSLPSTSGIQRLLDSIPARNRPILDQSDSDSSDEVRPTNRLTLPANGQIRPSPIPRQVISDSDESNDNTNHSDWDDLSEEPGNSPNVSHNFGFNELPGPKHIPNNAKEPIDFFRLFFTETLLEMFVKETNNYADQTISSMDNISPRSRFHSWTPITCSEMLAFITVVFNMGLNIKPTIKAYWTKNDSQYIPWFGKMFKRDRFENILSFFHMVDNTKLPKSNEPNYDPCQKFQPLLDYCNNTFQHYFIANQQISIDESLVGTKSHTSLTQYLPNKHHHRWGIKFWVFCDSVSKYCLKLFCYKGAKSNEDREDLKKFGLAYTVVKKLLLACNLLRKGYHLFIDNFFTSLPLLEWLYSERTFVTGTIRQNRKGLPDDIKKKFKVGEKFYKKKRNSVLLAYKEKKTQKKPVLLISSNTQVRNEEVTVNRRGREIRKEKPAMILDYNKHMGGIDGFDQMLYCYLDERRTVKYWKKVTFNFFSRMLLNSYIIYQCTCKNNNIKPLDRYQYIITIISKIGEDWMNKQPHNQAQNVTHKKLEKLPGNKQKTCWVCSEKGGHAQEARKRKRASTICSRCKDGCHYQCFSKHKCQ